MSKTISTTLYTDAGCPWAYSANPALRVLEWRYGSQLDWRLVMIGLTRGRRAVRRARLHAASVGARPDPVPPLRHAVLARTRKARVSATAPGCRAVVAARLLKPGSEWDALRALQFAQFTTLLVLTTRSTSAASGGARAGRIDASDVLAATRRGRRSGLPARQGRDAQRRRQPAESQGKTRQSDGPVRYTAPSVVFERDGTPPDGGRVADDRRLRRAGRQPRPDARTARPALRPGELLTVFPSGLTTAGGHALVTEPNDALDRPATERGAARAGRRRPRREDRSGRRRPVGGARRVGADRGGAARGAHAHPGRAQRLGAR